MATSQLHEDFSREEHVKAGSDRGFGFVFAGFFALVSALSWWRGHAGWHWTLPLAAAFVVVALVYPRLLAPLNKLWLKFGLLLYKVMNPLVLGLLFFVTITPIGLVMRLFGKDFLRLRLDREAKSYWIERTPPGPPPQSMKNQF
jgi:predicted membrane metal-binding protein